MPCGSCGQSELATGRCVRTFDGHTGIVGSVAVTMDGRFVVSGGDDGTVRIWEIDWNLKTLCFAG